MMTNDLATGVLLTPSSFLIPAECEADRNVPPLSFPDVQQAEERFSHLLAFTDEIGRLIEGRL